MNDSDMEFIALEEIELTDNPGNANVLTPDANIHVANKKTAHAKELHKRFIILKRYFHINNGASTE